MLITLTAGINLYWQFSNISIIRKFEVGECEDRKMSIVEVGYFEAFKQYPPPIEAVLINTGSTASIAL